MKAAARTLASLVGTALLGALLTSCHGGGDAVLTVVVTASGSPTSVARLEVTLNGPAGPSAAVSYARGDGQPIAFPTTLSAVVPARATGALTIEVRAVGSAGDTVAMGHEGPIAVKPGDRQTVYVELDCGGAPCTVDAGVPVGPDGGPSTGNPSCGNGRVDPTETCDTAISPHDPGACPPPDCSDGVACTKDVASGDGCTIVCTHTEITQAAPGDFCCPMGATGATDSDCSPACGDGSSNAKGPCCGNGTVDANETCDTAIPPGYAGACPLTLADCKTGNPCLDDRLIAAGTCSATCVHYPVLPRLDAQDSCCPPGATRGVDLDCPVVCGDGIKGSGESCDPGIPTVAMGGCPTACPSSDPCNPMVLTGAGCQAACLPFPITAPISGDGCCLPGSTHAQDTDCPASCGDGVVEPGEACDKAISPPEPFSCPTACPDPPSACLTVQLVGSTDDCSARCVTTSITACSTNKDGCCPAGCTAATDPDCSLACGNGFLDPTLGETCDTAIRADRKGACPTSCTSSDPCTQPVLLSAGTCTATCVLLPITEARAGDGCCPFRGDASFDSDCAAICGNGVVEPPVEHCDRLIPGSCPTSCPAAGSCTTVELRATGTCGATCVATPIAGCAGGDGCCPSGCTALTDSDCPAVCGDGALEAGETCDRAITPGKPGACLGTCDDGDACTIDVAAGSVEACTRTCAHVGITACLGGDGCCPAGCTGANDSDCAPICGDGKIGAGETCDPPATCPTTCPDDGNPCTRERLDGDPRTCTAACRHDPITTCSGTTSDACCPTGCTGATDTDC